MKFTYYGHSAFVIEAAKKKLLFNPFIMHNHSAKNIDVIIIKADHIFIS